MFPLGQGLQGYINLKGYGEFGNSARPSGWNTWLTFAIFACGNASTRNEPDDYEIGAGLGSGGPRHGPIPGAEWRSSNQREDVMFNPRRTRVRKSRCCKIARVPVRDPEPF